MRLSHVPPSRRLVQTERGQRSGGYILVMFGLLLIPLLLMVGLSVDVGLWYNKSADIQKAADAAALAGVVWLPDEAKARVAALEAAKRNGYDNADPKVDVAVVKSTKSPRRLQVVIKDRRSKSVIYSALIGSDPQLGRDAFAEYITPVPMGSPRNYFGTGPLLDGDQKEMLYQSVNTYCSSKANGDRHQSANDSGPSGSTNLSSICTNTPGQADFRYNGYELYVEAPATRTDTINLLLLDPQFTTSARSLQVQTGETCTTTYEYTWPTNINTGWTIGTSNGSVTGPRQYQTRSSNTSTTWTPNPPNFVAQGSQSASLTGNRYRYRSPLTTTPTTTCTPTYGTKSYPALDRHFNGSAAENYTIKVFSADSTPLDDSDNPLICSKTFTASTPYDDMEYLGSARWVTMPKSNTDGSPCAITTAMRSGKYIVRITNALAPSNKADGENNWGIVARYQSSSGDGLCEGRTDTKCPRVYGKDAISVRAAASTTTADFYLAEIAREHAGKKLRIELWDPGEGGQSIEILQPTGTNSWSPHTLDWSEPTRGGENGVSIVNVRVNGVDQFNARLLSITVDLRNYNPPTDNNWWKIRYRFTGTVTDRTTWSARILGDPVHLVEE